MHNQNENKKTAQEVPVQEQLVVTFNNSKIVITKDAFTITVY